MLRSGAQSHTFQAFTEARDEIHILVQDRQRENVTIVFAHEEDVVMRTPRYAVFLAVIENGLL